ncbi:MAG: low molecular weight protein-tyrosine-phosphatase [Pseudomonadota bacterium]
MAQATKPQTFVLFVCLGNICRSPMAEGALRAAAKEAGLDITVDSVGTAAYHIGERPDPRAIATAASHSVDISGARGRQLSRADFDRFTYIFAMDASNLAGIEARAPNHATAEIGLLLDLVDGRQGEPVQDPYYGDDSGFEQCWQTIGEAIDVLVERLKSQH